MKGQNNDYRRGYQDGINDSLVDSRALAYYAGVGYGKKEAGEKHLGFQDPEHLESFNRGVRNKDKHFISVKKEQGFFERLFDFKGRRAERNRKRNRKRAKKNKVRSVRRHQKQARAKVRKSGWKKNNRFRRKKR